MDDDTYDVIIVGGGMAGVHAAWPLVHAGKRVLMLDGGVCAPTAAPAVHAKDFEELRAGDEEQYRLFLGDTLKAVVPSARGSHASSMTSGSRAYVSDKAATLLPLSAEGMEITQSLAKGGLSEAWGGACAVFTKSELTALGIPAAVMKRHYQDIMQRIGISGSEKGYETQPPAHLTETMKRLLARYHAVPEPARKGFSLRQPLLGLLTQKLKGRNAVAYRDLDYYTTDETALYRARYTLEELLRYKNFRYHPGQIVERVKTLNGMQEAASRDFHGGRTLHRARRVILAAGAINTTRIALQSGFIDSAELLIKSNHIIACLDIHALRIFDGRPRHSLCQVTLDLPGADGGSTLYAHLYNYRSLLLWKLLDRLPLPAPEAFSLLAMYIPAFVLVDTRLPCEQGTCTAKLESGTLVIRRNPREALPQRGQLRELKRFLRKLGLFSLHTANPPLGASVHYAGGVPVRPSGELMHQTGIYAADSSGWKALPGKPPALTIMANANRIGEEVRNSLDAMP